MYKRQKQPRASHDGIKEFYYFLAADDRIGDLMHEQNDADRAYSLLQRYNGSHYVPTADGQAQLNGNPPAPFPANLPPRSDAPRGVTSPVSYTHLDVYKRQRWSSPAPCAPS